MNAKYFIPILFAVMLLAGCSSSQPEFEEEIFENPRESPFDVSLRATDMTILKAKYYPNNNSQNAVILIHDIGKSKEDWNALLPVLQREISVLTIDLRGHGGSEGSFSEEGFALDLTAAQNFLVRRGFEGKYQFIAYGESANLLQDHYINSQMFGGVQINPSNSRQYNDADTGSLVIIRDSMQGIIRESSASNNEVLVTSMNTDPNNFNSNLLRAILLHVR